MESRKSRFVQAEAHGPSKQITFLVCFALLAIVPIKRSTDILFRVTETTLPDITANEFVTGWPSGYGIKELAEYLKRRSADDQKGIDVIRLKYLGSIYFSLNLYLASSPSLTFYSLRTDAPYAASGRYDLTRELPDLTHASLLGRRRTFLIHDTTWIDDVSPADLNRASKVWSYPRPGGKSSIEVWELSPDHRFLRASNGHKVSSDNHRYAVPLG